MTSSRTPASAVERSGAVTPDRTDADSASRAFRRTAGSFATGVTIASSVLDDIPFAMTINAFSTVSLDPMLVLACLGRNTRLLSFVRGSGQLAVTVLAADQQMQAQWFANAARPSGAAAFAGFRTHRAPETGCLLFSDGLAYFDCRVDQINDVGDHAVVVARVLSFGPLQQGKEPLLFVGGAFVGVPAAGGRPHGPRATGGLAR